MKCFRRIAGKTRRDRIRNERIREDLGQEGKENILVKRQLKWYGHVVRMGEDRKPKQFLEARPEGRRPRGRPRKSHEDGIEEFGRRKGKILRDEDCCRPRKMEGVRRGCEAPWGRERRINVTSYKILKNIYCVRTPF
jgi:hypothetical protein